MSHVSSKVVGSTLGRWPLAFVITAWVMAGFFLAQIAFGIVLSLLEALPVADGADGMSPLFQTVSAAIIYTLSIGFTFGLPMLLKKPWPSRQLLGLTRLPTLIDLLLVPAGFVAYFIVSWLLLVIADQYIPGFNLEQTQDVGFVNLSGFMERLLAFATIVIIAPVAEEVLMRGYLFGNLRPRIGFAAAAGLASLAFAILHFQLNVGIDVLALSLVMCTLREATGSIWAGMMLHMLKNGLAFYVLFIDTGLLN